MLSTTVRAARPLGIRAGIIKPYTSRFWLPSWTRPTPGTVASCRPLHCSLRTQLSSKPPQQPNKIDKDFEKKAAQKTLEARPNEVTSSSSVRRVVEQSQAPREPDPDIMVGLKGDVNTIKETFALATVPREAYALGLAGTLPYLATSLSTVFLSWNLNNQWPTQSNFVNSFLFTHDSATHWLQILEPIQVGYGAVIISFLGAIHWGLEFAEKQPAHDRTQLRYGIGVMAPAVAWPTIFMPIEWALTTQFAAFCALYFIDSRATVKGWTPPWYGTYRFVLTAVVGAAILISLVGRAKVGEGHTRLSTAELKDRIQGKPNPSDRHRNWAKEEEEEKRRIRENKEREEKIRKEGEKKAEGGEKKAEGGEKKAEGGEKKAEGGEEEKKKLAQDKAAEDNGSEKNDDGNKDGQHHNA